MGKPALGSREDDWLTASWLLSILLWLGSCRDGGQTENQQTGSDTFICLTDLTESELGRPRNEAENNFQFLDLKQPGGEREGAC